MNINRGNISHSKRRTSDNSFLSTQNNLLSKLDSLNNEIKSTRIRYGSLDFNKINSQTEKHYLSNKVHRNLASMSYINIDPSKFTNKNYIKILKKEPTKRTLEESTIIKHFIENSNLKNKLKKDGIEQSNFDKMAIIYSTYVKYGFFEKNKIIYKNDDPSEMIYIVLSGKVILSIPEQKNESLTGYEYYCKLIDMENNFDDSLLRKTISINKPIIKIDYNDFKRMKNILLKIISQRKGILKITKEDLDNLKINLKEIDIDYKIMSKNEISDKINDYIVEVTLEDCQKYEILLDKKRKKDLIIYYYQNIDDAVNGNYFGDCENYKYLERAITFEDTELCLLNSNIYNEYLENEGGILRTKDLNFLFNSFFFSQISKRKFEREYYPLFMKEILTKGTILFKENSPVKFIYFISNGNIELSTKKSVLETHAFIKYLNNILDEDNNNHFVNDDSFFPNLINHPNQIINDLSKNNLRRVFIYDKKEMLSVIPFFYGMNNFFTAIVHSDDAIVFKMSVNHLPFILASEDEKTYNLLEKICSHKLEIIKNRFININNISLSVIDKNFVDVLTERKESFDKEKKHINVNNMISNKIEFDNKKKILLNNNILKNNNIRNIKSINLENIIIKDNNMSNNINQNIFENIYKKKSQKKNKDLSENSIPKLTSYEDRLYKKVKKNMSNSPFLNNIEFASNSPTFYNDKAEVKTRNNFNKSKTSTAFLTSLNNNISNYNYSINNKTNINTNNNTNYNSNNNTSQSTFFNNTINTLSSLKNDVININNNHNQNISMSISNLGSYKTQFTLKKLQKYKVIDDGEFPNLYDFFSHKKKKNWRNDIQSNNQFQFSNDPKMIGAVFRTQYKLNKKCYKLINEKKIIYKRFKEKLNEKYNKTKNF